MKRVYGVVLVLLLVVLVGFMASADIWGYGVENVVGLFNTGGARRVSPKDEPPDFGDGFSGGGLGGGGGRGW